MNDNWKKYGEAVKTSMNEYLLEYLITSPRTEYEKGWNAAIKKMISDNKVTLKVWKA